MVTKPSLNGKKVLVTRPDNQSDQLTKMIEQAGGEAISFPVIAIEFIAASQWWQDSILQQDWLIFVSRNAVESFISAIQQPLPDQIKLAAVGQATADSLQQHQLNVDLTPEQSVGSEGLLASPLLQNVQGQAITIVRGKGGRELLADTLRQRGANIHYIEVYERVIPSKTDEQCQQAAQADLLIATSVASVDNLVSLLSNSTINITTRPLVVLSERIRQHALTLGFNDVSVTSDASDLALMQCLMEIQ